MKLFVGNLPWKATEAALRELFEELGEVVSVKIVTDQYTGKSKGFGFVEFNDMDACNEAVRQLNDKDFLGRPLKVSIARERAERSQGFRSNWNKFEQAESMGG